MRVAAFLAAALLAGCASGPAVVDLAYPFDAEQAAQLLQPGTNTITGSALMRQKGGGVVTCAGLAVHLIPATEYAERRMNVIYGTGKFAGLNQFRKFTPENPAYERLIRNGTCNAQGFFHFDRVADGTFFVQTTIVWRAGQYDTQGGGLMTMVTVKGGQTVEVTLAP